MSSDTADDLTREVYCVLGIPIDAIDMNEALRQIREAVSSRRRFLMSTPNLNFAINSRSDADLRDSVLESDLCPADGMPVVWIARTLGVPIQGRVAGSDMLDRLRDDRSSAAALKVFLFGGADGVAMAAAKLINEDDGGLRCVGSMQPGYGSIEQLSTNEIIQKINASGADLLVVALGAAKGQAWLRRNHLRLTVPVRAHLGAAVNFQAGVVKRAPTPLRTFGLEWLWRIKEEPYLWRRYVHDGSVLLRLLVTRVWPLAIAMGLQRRKLSGGGSLFTEQAHTNGTVVLTFKGAAVAANINQAITFLRESIRLKMPITIDMTDVNAIDARFIGLLLMVRKIASGEGLCLNFKRVSPYVARMFRLHDVDFLMPAKGNT